jgi:SIR2-like domain
VTVNFERLEETYCNPGIVLVLGSGISVGSGLPNWSGLLKRVAEGVAGSVEPEFFKQLRCSDFGLPVVASILEERSSDRQELIERVREALYRDFPFFPSGVTEDDRPRLVHHVHTQNPTLRAVGSLCASNRGTNDFTPNRKIHAVVTFNLDALLQAYVRARYGKRLLRTVERPSASSNPEKISIYHMHGLLRFDRKAHDPTKEAADAVVLTEQDYFNFFNNPMSLFNYTFMYLLREFSCLFIGLSMQDENIRRLLHFSKFERLRGYESEGLGAPVPDKLIRHFAVLRQASPAVDDALEESLRPLGTTVLWIRDYAEIPSQLQKLYEAGGGEWELVF